MKKIFFLALALMALFAMSAMAAEWTGAISESGCGLKHADGGAEKCVTACVKKGAAPVFVTDGKVLKISNADKVNDHLGKKVKVTGKLEGDTVTIVSIAAAQ
ncbi:MAG: hypothetical protein FJW20_15150 [Acidimicrobiia bacterium]|nr:hypothetical protein [Acidimicrobiia bacterium]